MGYEVIAFIVVGLAIAAGWLWSVTERRKAVQAAFEQIRDEVTGEHDPENY